MNTILSRLVTTGLFFLVIFLSGFWLSRSGKPYPVTLFTIHKLIALGALIYLGRLVIQTHQSTALSLIQITAVIMSAICILVLFITGALSSLDKVMPDFLLRMHQIIPFLTILSIGVTLYLILFQRNVNLPGAI